MSFVIRLQQNNEAGSFLYMPPGGTEQKYEMDDMDYDGSTLSCEWVTARGAKMDCRLQKWSSTLLSGDCLDSSGQRAATMSLKPPLPLTGPAAPGSSGEPQPGAQGLMLMTGMYSGLSL